LVDDLINPRARWLWFAILFTGRYPPFSLQA
jgi:hypothetical protein